MRHALLTMQRPVRMRRSAAALVAATFCFIYGLEPAAAFIPGPGTTYTLRQHSPRVTMGRGATVVYQRRKPTLDEELDSLRLDESKLSDEEKAQLKAFRDAYDLPDVLNFDKQQGTPPSGSTSSSMRAEDDDDYDPLDDAEDVAITDTPWSGQAGLDVVDPGSSSWADLTKRLDLVVGDALALVLFAIVGRSMHMHTLALDVDALKTALPFLASWIVLAPLLGSFTLDATKSLGGGIFSVVKGWAVAMPVALALRGLVKGEVPPTPFIVVSMVSTLIFLAGWRSAYISAQGNQDEEQKGNKSGGIFDIFRMVTTLINRW